MLSITGEAITAALENAVSHFPALEPRFPQVSNISFDLNSSAPSHSRVTNIHIGHEALNPTQSYRVVVGDYMARGKLDFHSLHATSSGGTAREIVAADEGLQIYELILRFFKAPEEFESPSWSSSSSSSPSSEENGGEEGEDRVEIEQPHLNLRKIFPRIDGRIRILGADAS